MYAIHRTRLVVASLALLVALPCSADEPSRQYAPPSAAGSAAPAEARDAVGRAARLPDFTALVERQGPAVVNIVTSRQVRASRPSASSSDEEALLNFFRHFIPDSRSEESPNQRVLGLGSGFIISRDGLIITNAHVVANARKVLVRLADGKREFEGRIVGSDIHSDVALVKIDAGDLPVVQLGNSSALKPGEWVAAIGAPFGFFNTVTAGIIGATRRHLPDESFVSFIQTDVPMNPGSSGGPLFNARGEVIGVNSIIYSRTGGYMGVSFAIPIESALEVAKELQAHGRVRRGHLAVDVQPVTRELARAFKLDAPRGVLVGLIEPGSAADKAQLRSGDVILAYNGKSITETTDLPRLVADSRPGSQARLEIWRNGARREIGVTVGELPSGEATAAAPADPEPPQASNRLGLVLREPTPEQRRKQGIDHGLLVESVAGPATASPIRPGDLIVTVNQARVSSLAEFNRLLSRQKTGDAVALLVRRGDAATYVPLKVTAGHG